MDLRRGVQLAVESVIETLESISKPITSKEEVMQVGTISANSDTEIGQLISDAMEKIGKEGVITVQDGKTLENELDVVEGMKFDRGYISPYFITDSKTQICELESPFILFVEKKVSGLNTILPVLENGMKMQRSVLIVAEDVESEALATLVVNKLRGGFKVCAVKAPGFGDNRKAILQDIASLTGATVISEELGLNVEAIELDQLGSCGKIKVTKDDTIILDGVGDKDLIADRVDTIRDAIDRTSSDYEKEKLQERLAKLSGGVAVIKVGGVSEVEVGEKRDRIVDALNATRAAVEQGIVPGGGTALVWASKQLDDVRAKCINHDQKIGVDIIERACRAPIKAIASNAGVEGAIVLNSVLGNTDHSHGYNAATDEHVNMFDAGIIDPTKVVRTALTDAFSVSGLLMTTETMICDVPDDEKPAPGGMPGGGMPGGMGGMPGGMGGMM